MFIKFGQMYKGSNPDLLRELEQGACYEGDIHIQDIKTYRKRWFGQENIGEKITVIAQEGKADEEGHAIGIICLWKNPCDQKKWHIEELCVSANKRNQGVREGLVIHAINILREQNEEVESVSLNEGEERLVNVLNEVLEMKACTVCKAGQPYIQVV